MGDGDCERCVKCEVCGDEFFTLVKMYTNDVEIERTLRCTNGHLRVDKAALPPAHAL